MERSPVFLQYTFYQTKPTYLGTIQSALQYNNLFTTVQCTHPTKPNQITLELYNQHYSTITGLLQYSVQCTVYSVNILPNQMGLPWNYRVTHKGWDFRDDCTKFILSRVLYMIPCNCKLFSFLAKSFSKSLKGYI